VKPRIGAFAAVVIWYRLEAPPGAYAPVLAPDRAMIWYQIPSLAPNPGQRYHLLFQQPLLMSHLYRLQQQLVPLAWTFGPFSSSGCKNFMLEQLVTMQYWNTSKHIIHLCCLI